MIYWNDIKDNEALLENAKSVKGSYEEDMSHVVQQAGVYQNFHDSTADNAYSLNLNNRSASQKKLAYNVISVIVDGVLNRTSKLKPKPSFIPLNYVYSKKSKFKSLDSTVLSILKKQNFHSKSIVGLKNAYIQNVGIIKSFPEDKTPVFFPVDIENFYTSSPYEGYMDRECAGDKTNSSVLEIYKDIYPNMKKSNQRKFMEKYEISDIDNDLRNGTFQNMDVSVYDFYSVKRGKEKGKRLVFTDEVLLLNEDWDYEFIPYDFLYYTPPQRGIIGVGVSEILTPIQQRINTLLRKISKSLDISFYPNILAHANARVKRAFSDEAGQITTWFGGIEPKQLTQAITHPQNIAHLDHLIHYAFRSLSMDETALATNVPENTNKASGVAIKNLETAEQSKIYLKGKSYEDFAMSVSKKVAQYVIQEGYNDLLKNEKDMIKELNVWPVSFLPSTPEGKFQRVEFLIQAGFMSPEEIADMYDFPEFAGHTLSQKGSLISAIHKNIEDSLMKKEEITPDIILGYSKQLDIAKGIYAKLLLESDKYEEEITLLRNFISICSDEVSKIQQQQMQQQIAIQQMLNNNVQPSGSIKKAS